MYEASEVVFLNAVLCFKKSLNIFFLKFDTINRSRFNYILVGFSKHHFRTLFFFTFTVCASGKAKEVDPGIACPSGFVSRFI